MSRISPAGVLRVVKLAHTVIWAVFAGLIVIMPVLAWQRRFGAFLAVAALVAVEVLVLAFNGLTCPLTPVAARYTSDRRPNFDIYLPLFVARYNKQIFGPLYLAGLLLGLARWLTR